MSAKKDPKQGILFSKVRMYYFSGTGNSRQVAEWIKEVAEKNQVEARLENIPEIGHDPLEIDSSDLIGFFSPTHGFNFPPIMLKFLWHFPKGRNKVFIMNTRAGVKLWKLHLFGLSGLAQLFAAFILKVKGYKIVGMRPVDLPSNWISLHPGLRKKVVVSMVKRCRRNTERFAQKILTGRRDFRALFDILQDLAISPVAIGYYFVGRYVLAKSFIASSACTMCRLCIDRCPVQAIMEIDRRPYWTFRCESCMQCMNHCPERAIQTAHGLVIGSLYLLFTVGMEWLYFYSADKLPEGSLSSFLHHGTSEFLIASALCIPFLWLSYRLLHYLMRFKFVEWLVIYTSLTVFRFWRRYKGPAVGV